jgi:porphobilinogen synthase
MTPSQLSAAQQAMPQHDVVLTQRPRRLRRTAVLRDMVREHRLSLDSLVQPIFVDENILDARKPIGSMPGIDRCSLGEAVKEAQELFTLGVRSILLFGIPRAKDECASTMSVDDGIVQRTIRAIKTALPDMVVIADLCACEYTSHGHCGIVDLNGVVDNDRTLTLLARTALSYAHSGVDIIAPSDMMDGRIGVLRKALDGEGFSEIALMSYAVKYASAFYGPFREAADSAPSFGDRRSYQMDPANRREALREARLDLAEGADMLIVKPAMVYLDIVRELVACTDVPLAVYNVSGEYAMVKAAAAQGWIDEARIVDEIFASFARAGASIVISYFSKSYAQRYGAL